MEHWSSEIQNHVHNFFNHRQVNILVTSVLIFVSIYFSIVTALGQHVFHPFGNANDTRADLSIDVGGEVVKSSMSLFFVISLGLLGGRLFFYVRLPPSIGCLLLGIALRNIPIINEWLWIHPTWDLLLGKLSFAVLLVRCCLGIDLSTVITTPVVLLALGGLAPLLESTAICLAAHLIFAFPLGISLIFGLLLGATSQAVIIPSLLNLQNKNLGTDKGIPSLIVACASIDNLLLVILYSVIQKFVFSPEAPVEIILATIGEVVASVLVGNLLGWLLWWFPRRGDTYTHLARTILLVSLCVALLFSSVRLNVEFAGVISLVTTCLTAIRMWRVDSEKKTFIEEKTFATFWNLIFQPILFVMFGMKFDIPNTSGQTVAIGLAILGIGVGIRALAVILLTLCSGLSFAEQLVFVGSFFPKATIQAVLAPSIVLAASGWLDLLPYSQMILAICVVSILITAPLGQLFLDVCAPQLLRKDFVQSVNITPSGGYYGSSKIDQDGFDPSLGQGGYVSYNELKSSLERERQERQQQRAQDSHQMENVWSGGNNGIPIEDQARDYERYVDQRLKNPSNARDDLPVIVSSPPPQVERFPTPSFMKKPPPSQNSPSFQRF
ncbi:unnamed protein product, partial [Mesorhabditis belari]|uniref:Cation/H+ exchanger transmembrane domain-containing protein n=2 Tax=Mesorhabditis belari TaxID=2138241 RepID=A0AAF3FIW3_9BILA